MVAKQCLLAEKTLEQATELFEIQDTRKTTKSIGQGEAIDDTSQFIIWAGLPVFEEILVKELLSCLECQITRKFA